MWFNMKVILQWSTLKFFMVDKVVNTSNPTYLHLAFFCGLQCFFFKEKTVEM
jgi:hypothetical protein